VVKLDEEFEEIVGETEVITGRIEEQDKVTTPTSCFLG
jgi:hypothetical protein